MNYWLIILAMGIVTFSIRLLPIVLLGRIDIPLVVQRALRFVPPAVLSAIIAPELLMPGGEFSLSLGNARLIAGVIATIVAWRTKNVLATIAVGMIAFWVLQGLTGH
ncbi:MAG: AzlD domain-containing protein [Chloroflexi bacterium]|nr:AzlD domain-containing protein [Chloroflexota bacterium]